MFTKIAVATDGSPLAGKAVETAIALARQCGAELAVFHVLMHGEPPESLKRMAEVEHLVTTHPNVEVALHTLPGPMISARADVERHRLDHQIIATIGDMIIKQAKEKAVDGGVASVSGETLEGETSDEILAAAKRIEADLIVLGTRGLNPLKGLFVGSVSQKVSQRAECACLIVK